jgi:hypothetical protein
VTTIGDMAFTNCTALTEITYLNPVPPTINEYTFYSVPSSRTLWVPAGSVVAYRAANNWKNFETIAVIGGAVPDVYFEQPDYFHVNDEKKVHFTTTRYIQDFKIEVVSQTVPDGWEINVAYPNYDYDGYNGYFTVKYNGGSSSPENEALVVAYDALTGRSTVRAIKLKYTS